MEGKRYSSELINRVTVKARPGHTGDTTAVELSMGFSVSYLIFTYFSRPLVVIV